MRLGIAFVLALLGAALPSAQTSLDISNPDLVVAGDPMILLGAPLATTAFDALELAVPGHGTFVISDRPFDGARLAGEFRGRTLAFAAEGTSIRLRTLNPMIGAPGARPAFVHTEAAPSGNAARVALTRVHNGVAPVSTRNPTRTPPPRASESAPVERELAAMRSALNRAERDIQRLRGEIANKDAEIDRLQRRPPNYNDRLQRLQSQLHTQESTIQRLRTERDSLRALTDGAEITLPGFDLSRLRNAESVRHALRTTPYPTLAAARRLDGEVLVLFQTDPDGNVVRAAVAQPVGGGLDELAEDLVRSMHFRPSTVEDQATGLRSQVRVRFALRGTPERHSAPPSTPDEARSDPDTHDLVRSPSRAYRG